MGDGGKRRRELGLWEGGRQTGEWIAFPAPDRASKPYLAPRGGSVRPVAAEEKGGKGGKRVVSNQLSWAGRGYD